MPCMWGKVSLEGLGGSFLTSKFLLSEIVFTINSITGLIPSYLIELHSEALNHKRCFQSIPLNFEYTSAIAPATSINEVPVGHVPSTLQLTRYHPLNIF